MKAVTYLGKLMLPGQYSSNTGKKNVNKKMHNLMFNAHITVSKNLCQNKFSNFTRARVSHLGLFNGRRCILCVFGGGGGMRWRTYLLTLLYTSLLWNHRFLGTYFMLSSHPPTHSQHCLSNNIPLLFWAVQRSDLYRGQNWREREHSVARLCISESIVIKSDVHRVLSKKINASLLLTVL